MLINESINPFGFVAGNNQILNLTKNVNNTERKKEMSVSA
jgi:hypothetical protein